MSSHPRLDIPWNNASHLGPEIQLRICLDDREDMMLLVSQVVHMLSRYLPIHVVPL